MNAPCTSREEQISALVPMVHKLAGIVSRKIGSRAIDREDLIGAGYEAIVRAYDEFDPSRSASLHTHAKNRATWAMLNAARAWDPVDDRHRTLLRHADAFAFDFASANGRMPTQAEIEERLPGYVTTLARVNQMAMVAFADVAKEDVEFEPAASQTTEDAVLERERQTYAHSLLEALPEKQRAVVVGHYLLDRPLSIVARAIGTSRDYTSRIHNRALRMMRRFTRA